MKNLVIIFLVVMATDALAQSILMTRTGQISFYSKTPMENIDAVNNEVTSMLNTQTAEVAYAVLIKSFRFEKALMEEHFNENYMESTKFPKATFSGKIVNPGEINFSKNGKYAAKVEGEMTIHGVKQPLTSSGIIEVAGDKVTVASTFTLKLADFEIKIPSLVADKISETIEVKVNCLYEPKK